MRLLFVLLLAVGMLSAYSAPAMAVWAEVPVESLYEQAVLVIQGIVDRTEPGYSWGGRDYEFVVIDISDVLKGNAVSDEVRLAQPALTSIAKSNDIRFRIGEAGVWLLDENLRSPGDFSVSHPSQYQREGVVVETFAASQNTGEVPEPTTFTLALAALCLAMSRRRAF